MADIPSGTHAPPLSDPAEAAAWIEFYYRQGWKRRPAPRPAE